MAVSLQNWKRTADLDESLEAGFATDNTPVFLEKLYYYFLKVTFYSVAQIFWLDLIKPIQ